MYHLRHALRKNVKYKLCYDSIMIGIRLNEKLGIPWSCWLFATLLAENYFATSIELQYYMMWLTSLILRSDGKGERNGKPNVFYNFGAKLSDGIFGIPWFYYRHIRFLLKSQKAKKKLKTPQLGNFNSYLT